MLFNPPYRRKCMHRLMQLGAIATLTICFVPLTQAQSSSWIYPSTATPYWQTLPTQSWQTSGFGTGISVPIQGQSPYAVPQTNWMLQQYYSPQNQTWRQLQEWNTFQQQYRSNYNPYQLNNYPHNGYEPEVYAPRVPEPGGDVLLEPGDDY